MEGSVLVGVAVALLVPFAGNTLGAALVFLLRRGMSERLSKALAGFAAGVMMAASVWSLIIPALEASEGLPVPGWLPAAAGFLAGMLLLLAVDHFTPHLHAGATEPEGPTSALKKSTMMLFALAIHNLPEGMAVGVVLAGFLAGDPMIHNLPEGMAVGVVLAGFLAGDPMISLASVVALSVGIAIQNVPEGAIVSLPLVSNGLSRPRAFAAGTLCGAVEPAGAMLMVAITGLATPILPYVLAFAAGAMVYVVVEELIPQTQQGRHTNIGTIGVAAGFVLMMVLDVALG